MELLGRSGIRREILGEYAGNPQLETHPRELARKIGRSAPPVVREMRALEQRRILASTIVGPLRRYRMATTPEAVAARAALVGGHPTSEPTTTDHDRRLLRLHERVADKLRRDPERVMAKAYANLARWAEIDPDGNEPWIRAWKQILDQGPAAVALTLTGPDARMRELRQSSPFAGVLSNQERLQVIREPQGAHA